MKFVLLFLAVVMTATHAEEARRDQAPVSPPAQATAMPAAPTMLKVDVAGTPREALVFAPKPGSESVPLVFVFHGHGGASRQAARSIGIHRHWPEALVVYPQGLPTPGQLTDPEGKRAGWQRHADDLGNRDLAFFDTLLAQLKKDYRVDASRIYTTGHSNGGSFSYILWETRRDVFAAFAPSGAVSVRSARKLKPAPVMHIAGKEDPLVKFAWQERMMTAVRATNGVTGEGKPWAERATIFGAGSGTPVVQYLHPGGHEFPSDVSPLIVRFFKEHARK